MAKDDDLIQEIRDRFQYASGEWQEIRDEAKKDMLCVAGKVWEAMAPDGVAQRIKANRPFFSLDELGQYINQLVNEVRANPVAIKFSPTGGGATDKTAEFYGNKTREIEYRSHGQMVYTTAFENTVQRSYGFCRVNAKRANPRTTNQELWLEPFVNPDLVTPDPDALLPTSADMKYCFVHESVPVKEFARDYPDAQVRDFSPELRKEASSWFKGDRIVKAEYWKVKTRKRKLLVLKPFPSVDGKPPEDREGIFEDEPAAAQLRSEDIVATDQVDFNSVCKYITNGIEILKTVEWPGQYIPIVSCYGKVLYLDEGAGVKRRILSMVRLARDPLMLYCYYRTQQGEIAGMIPKVPIVGYEGQFEGTEDQWQKAPHEPLAYLTVKPTTPGTGNQILPLPQRIDNNVGEHLQSLELCAEGARRAIQAAMGTSPLPTQAQRRNEKSGKALQRIEESGEKGSFHFIDHYHDMIQQGGVVIEDLMDHHYDTARTVGVRQADETAIQVRINDPNVQDSISTKGEHLVTVSTGPSYDSEREAANEFVDSFVSSPLLQLIGPQKAPKIIAQTVRMRQLGVQGDELAEIIDPTPPKPGQPPDPQQLQQMLEEATGKAQQLEQVATQMKQVLDTDAAKQQAMVAKAKIDAGNALILQKMKDATSIAVAKINALTKGIVSENEAQIEAIALDHEAEQADLDRAHELAMGEVGHEQALAQGQQVHQQALEQGDQGIGGTLAAQQQQADLAPPPADTGAGA